MARSPKKSVPFKVYGPLAQVGNGVYNVETLVATRSILLDDASCQILNLWTSPWPVKLPVAETAMGFRFEIFNATTGTSRSALVKETGAVESSLIATLLPGENVTMVCNGTAWAHLGIRSGSVGTTS